ncbi:MAG: hypothetical protein NVSMB4_03980 [Acidimicrobiales bacterium]
MSVGPGSRVSGYEVQEVLGRGAMGVVYRAHHEGLGRTAAIKVLQAVSPDEDAVNRFRIEAQAVASMRHPNIVNVFDFGEAEGSLYMVVEFVSGGPLSARLGRGALDPGLSLKVLRGLAGALDYAHGLGVLHRDVKPDNVLLDPDDLPILVDFGLAKLAQSSLRTTTGVITGTPAYMAPEQVQGLPCGPETDRYALACVAYELITGRQPFPVEDMVALLFAHVHTDPSPTGLGRAVDEVVLRGLSKDRAGRWPSSTSMIDALAVAMAGGPVLTGTMVGAPPPILAASKPRSTPSSAPAYATASEIGAPPASGLESVRGRLATMRSGQRPGMPSGSAVATLLQMGVPKLTTDAAFSLNSHFANSVRAAREVAGDDWGTVCSMAGLSQYVTADPTDDHEHGTPVECLSALNDAFEAVYGREAKDRLCRWGRVATDRSLRHMSHAGTQQRAFKMLPGAQRKLTALLGSFTRQMDEVRGAHTHTWKQIDEHQFWLVHFSNLYALGRVTDERACHVWSASFESMLRWGGLANRWLVDEIECGCVTGTWDCVFAIRSVEAETRR